MKRLLIVGFFLHWICFAFAQSEQTLPQKLQYLYGSIDKNEAKTGLLFNLSVPLVDPSVYNGVLTDNVYADMQIFGALYGEFLCSNFTNGSILPSPSTYLDKIKSHTDEDPIDLAVMAVKYNWIRPDAYDLGLLKLDGDHVIDVPNRSLSPFYENFCFVAAPLAGHTSNLHPVFKLSSDLWFSNFNEQPTSIRFDASDGLGWRDLLIGESITINYTEAGEKELKFQAKYPWGQVDAMSKITIDASNPTGSEGTALARSSMDWPEDLHDIISVTATKPYMGEYGSATMHIYYNTHNGNCTRKLYKPLIVVEGYEEPGVTQSNANRMFAILNSTVWSGGADHNLTEYIYPYEYDLIYVDFKDGSDWIQRNAFVMEEIIKKVNEMKGLTPSNEKNVIIGVSMGGVVTSYALRDMQAKGPAHDTRLFVTYDSPLEGANIPIATQSLIRYLVNLSNIDPTGTVSIPNLDLAWQAIQRPTPRQLLLYHVDAVVSGTEPVNPVQTAFLAELMGLGPLGTRHVALSNGAGNGTLLENSLVAGMPFFALSGSKDILCLLGVCAMNLSFDIRLSATGIGTTNTMFAHVILDPLIPGFPSLDLLTDINVPTKPYDVSPGGTSNLGVSPLAAVVSGLTGNGFTVSGPGLTATQHCFIPAFSAVLAAEPAIFTTPQGCGSVSRCSLSESMEVTSLYTGMAEFNEYHIALDSRIANVLIEELVTNAPPLPTETLFNLPNHTLSTYYNAGLTHQARAIPDLSIVSANGKLSINNTGKTGFANAGDPESPFYNLTGYLKCGSTIEVEAGAQLVCGADSGIKNGSLVITEGGKVHIKSGGTLRVTSNLSALIIENGATLTLDAGAIVILEKSDSRIEINGKWVVNGDFNFSGLGYIDYNGEIEFGPNATRFRLIGALPYHRDLRLRKSIKLPYGINLELQKSGIELVNGSTFVVGGSSTVTCSSTEFSGDGVGLSVNGHGAVSLNSCNFKNITRPFVIVGTSGQGSSGPKNVKANGCLFISVENGGIIRKRDEVTFTDCHHYILDAFPTAPEFAFFSDDNKVAVFRNCTINGTGLYSGSEMEYGNEPLTETSPMSEGIRVQGGFLCWMDGGSINGCDIGIGNRRIALEPEMEQKPANILVTNKATIQDCIAGISMNGSFDQGSVIASCARFIDNKFGITGQDVTLLIDAAQMNPSPLYEPLPNYFRLRDAYGHGTNDSKFLTLCFNEKNPGGAIAASNNAWEVRSFQPNGSILIGAATPAQLLLSFDVRKSTLPNCMGNSSTLPVTTAPTAGPRDCDAALVDCTNIDGGCIRDCALALDGDGETTIRQQFLDGYDRIMAENWDDSETRLLPVSDLWQSHLPDETSDDCRAFIQASRSLVKGLERFESSWNRNRSPISDLLIMPNPAHDQFVIKLPEGVQHVEVFDLHGKKILDHQQAEKTVEISLIGWPTGIYVVKARNDEGQVKTAKVVVE